MTQQDYEELKAEVKKTMMAELFKTKKRLVNYEKAIYDYAFDRAYALGMQEKNLPDEGTDCTPVEADVPSYIPSTKSDVPSSEPKPSIPKFKHKLSDNRLQVASMAMAGLLANPTVNDYTDLQDAAHIDFIVEDAVTYADALIAKCEEGGDHD